MRRWILPASALAAALLAGLLTGCEKSDPTAPTNSTIELSANPASVDLRTATSGRTDLSALVLSAEGRPVSGIKVYFSTTSGSLGSGGDPVSADGNGRARDTLALTRDDDDATVTARASGAGTDTVTVSILLPGVNASPVPVLRASSSSVKTGQNVTFDGSDSNDPDGTIANFKWTFNFPTASGGSTTEFVEGDRAAAAVVTRTFPAAGTATVRLQVTDNQGKAASADLSPSVTIVSHYPPTARISGPTAVTATVPFTLDGSASADDPRDATGTIVRYDWDMGDGNVYINRTEPTVLHVYNNPTVSSPRTVTLVVWDNGDGTNCNPVTHLCNDSKSASATHNITVASP